MCCVRRSRAFDGFTVFLSHGGIDCQNARVWPRILMPLDWHQCNSASPGPKLYVFRPGCTVPHLSSDSGVRIALSLIKACLYVWSCRIVIGPAEPYKIPL